MGRPGGMNGRVLDRGEKPGPLVVRGAKALVDDTGPRRSLSSGLGVGGISGDDFDALGYVGAPGAVDGPHPQAHGVELVNEGEADRTRTEHHMEIVHWWARGSATPTITTSYLFASVRPLVVISCGPPVVLLCAPT